MTTTPPDRPCPRCLAAALPSTGSCARCGYLPAPSGGGAAAPPSRGARPLARAARCTLAGTVASRVSPGRHRPPEVAVAAVSLAILAVSAASSATSVGAGLSGGLSGLLSAALAGAAGLLLVVLAALLSLLGPLLAVIMVPLVVLVGIRVILVPLVGLPRWRGLRLHGGGLVTGVVGLLARLAATTVRAGVSVLRLLVTQLAAPRPSVTFTVTDSAGRPWQVRLLQEAPGLGHGDAVDVRGPCVRGVLHARRVRVTSTGVVLRPRTGAALPLAAALAALAGVTALTRLAG